MRLRPILMSSLTTIVGLLPMAIGSGVEMMESMAIVVIGGLIMSKPQEGAHHGEGDGDEHHNGEGSDSNCTAITANTR